MPSQTFTQASISVASFSVESAVSDFKAEGSLDVKPATTYGSGGFEEVRPGLLRGMAQLTGYTDFAVGAIAANLGAVPGAQVPMTIAIPGTTAGDPAWVLRGRADRQQIIGGTIGEMAPFSMSLTGDTAFGRGVLLHPSAARTTTANGTAVAQAGPATGQTLYAALHVLAASGTTPSLTVTVQSDDAVGFPSATTRITFSAATTTGWQWASVAGPFNTETHLRASWTISGTTPSFTFAVAAFIA